MSMVEWAGLIAFENRKSKIENLDMNRREWLLRSNLLSIARVVLAVPTVWLMVEGMRTEAVILFFVSAATDYLDGDLARRRGEVSELGKILDPLADKIYVAAAVITMLLLGVIPLWLVVVVLARDLLILAGGLYVERKTGRLLTSNWTGKWTVGLLSITLLVAWLGADESILTVLYIATAAMLALTTVLYGKGAVKVLGES